MVRGRGRGRGNFKITSNRDERASALDRLGKVVYPKGANADRFTKKYKFVKSTTITSSIATLPSEPRIRSIVKNFLRSYYEIHDQPLSRANLLSLYNDDSFFSFSSTFAMPSVGRNILQVVEPEGRINLLFQGKTRIGTALAGLAPTEHSVNSFSTDVPFYVSTPLYITALQLVITGTFKDTSDTKSPLRAFTRVFLLKLVSVDKEKEPKYEIFNDLFMLQPPTPDQIKRFHQDLQQQSRTNPLPSGGGAATKSDEDRKIRSIMIKTKMNREASHQLLKEFDWDEDKSVAAFNNLFAKNEIPQSCFTP